MELVCRLSFDSIYLALLWLTSSYLTQIYLTSYCYRFCTVQRAQVITERECNIKLNLYNYAERHLADGIKQLFNLFNDHYPTVLSIMSNCVIGDWVLRSLANVSGIAAVVHPALTIDKVKHAMRSSLIMMPYTTSSLHYIIFKIRFDYIW